MKFLSFHSIPWCFQVMGNHLACVHHLPPDASPSPTVKLIKSDGHVKIYHRPVNAAELMLEFPKHLICHSDSFFIGQKIPALSEKDELKLGHKYFLLPKHFFQSVLSFVTIASFASSSAVSSLAAGGDSAKKTAFVKKAAACKPFEIHKTASGTLQIRVSDEFISKLLVEGSLREEEQVSNSDCLKGKVCTTPQLLKDYSQLVECRRSTQWKPKLETIREKERKRRLASLRKKSQSKPGNKNQKSEKNKQPKAKAPPPPPPLPPPPPPSFPTIKGKKRSSKS